MANNEPTLPREGDIWGNSVGAERYVRGVDEDNRVVTYSRPANGHADFQTISTAAWLDWVERTDGVRKRAAKGTPAKDWGYATPLDTKRRRNQ